MINDTIAAVFEPAQGVSTTNLTECSPKDFDQRLVQAGLGSTKDVLELGERLVHG